MSLVPVAEGACAACLARPLLLRALAAHLDRAVDFRRGERARDILALDDEALIDAIAGSDAARLHALAADPASVADLRMSLRQSGCWSVCVHDPSFPAGLEVLGASGPRALFGAGRVEALIGWEPERSVAVVGSRRCSPYGEEVADRLGELLSGSGIRVISGLALGIDSRAHGGALRAARAPTLAVLGTGADRPYPRSRRALFASIRGSGAVVSELPPGTPTFRWMFPARNRLMAALGGMTIVVEAAERSGSLITAEMALECGRQVGAVPGQVTSWRSAGANKLIAEGAALIRDAQDALDALLGPGVTVAESPGPVLDGRILRVLGAVEAGSGSIEAVARSCAIPFPEAAASLGSLELDGYVSTSLSGRYARTAQPLPPPVGEREQPGRRGASASTIGG